MTKQIIFAFTLAVTLGIFAFTVNRLISFFRFTKPSCQIKDFWKRTLLTIEVAFGQTKIFRKPVVGLAHALVFWGFCFILFGSVEMIIDGLFRVEKSLKVFGPVYDFIMAAGDIFALVIAILIIFFLVRRIYGHIKRFEGIEMKPSSHKDANLSLTLILLLMISLMDMNIGYVGFSISEGTAIEGKYPVAGLLLPLFGSMSAHDFKMVYEVSWWVHILLIFLFANYLPYSKHFHVFLSVPNVFLTRLEPLGKLPNMDSITREVRLMMDPEAAFQAIPEPAVVERFGVKDAEDSTWKNYFDSLSCTQCGRCTSVCPANITGKRLSPRKIMMDLRSRMKEKGPNMVKYGKDFNDNRSLLRDFITEEEIWACTTCNACAKECPVNINHPTLIVDMRRYLVMEEASAPGELKIVFNNIENNGAPWQYSSEDRLNWVKDLELNTK
ncbi:MAG: (Fe-S)-binding protein [Bacteroidales bacterium]|jgi:heterodisulfide reductase subunit C|nr:(Fe-S)-binding protein [Bacteroidales bacterium]